MQTPPGLNRWRSRRCRACVLLAGFVLALPVLCRPLRAAASTSPGTLEEYVTRVESSYRGVKTLRAAFVQTYVAGGRTRVESGLVYFARGGRMRWEYQKPESKLFLCDGKQLLLYVPGEKQLTRSSVKSSADARLPFRLLLSRLNLHKVFGQIEFNNQVLHPDSGDLVLRALPKLADQDMFHEVFIELTPDFDIRALLIRYADESTMQFKFSGIDRNVSASPNQFQFTPPAGTEVIDQK